MNHVYLGWGNHRKAYCPKGHSIIVLIKDDNNSVVLVGGDADACRSDLNGLSHHLCGVKRSAAAAAVLADAPHHKHDLHAYDAIFDRHYLKGIPS